MPRPIVRTPANRQAELLKFCKNLEQKIIKTLKSQGASYGEIRIWHRGDLNFVEVENNLGGFGEEIMYMIKNHPRVKVINVTEYPGHYDWAADVYIKDSCIVEFHFS